MPVRIRPQCVYYDTKSYERLTQRTKKKGKLASYMVADVYHFFELTSKQYVQDRHRVDIERSDLEGIEVHYLQNDAGCIKIKDPEILSEAELLAKRRDLTNTFKKIARLCDAKWAEVQDKTRSASLRTGRPPMDVARQTELISCTTDPAELDEVLRKLRII